MLHLPQHRATPSVLRAHVCAAPAATALAVFGPPRLTATGTFEGAPQQLPCPRAPRMLLPQHHTAPSLIAQACALPALT